MAKQNKVKFNLGHFPIGTVFEYEDPMAGYLNDEERALTGELYHRTISTVVAIRDAGANSWCIEMPVWQDSGKCLMAVNMQWVRRIVRRGTGKLIEQDQIHVDELRKRRKDYMTEHHPNWREGFASMQSNGIASNGNTYQIEYLPEFIFQWMKERGYEEHGGQHLYDNDFIRNFMHANLPYVKKEWGMPSYTVRKKKFAKLMKQALAKGKRSRRTIERIEEASRMEEFERDFDSLFGDV